MSRVHVDDDLNINRLCDLIANVNLGGIISQIEYCQEVADYLKLSECEAHLRQAIDRCNLAYFEIEAAFIKAKYEQLAKGGDCSQV